MKGLVFVFAVVLCALFLSGEALEIVYPSPISATVTCKMYTPCKVTWDTVDLVTIDIINVSDPKKTIGVKLAEATDTYDFPVRGVIPSLYYFQVTDSQNNVAKSANFRLVA